MVEEDQWYAVVRATDIAREARRVYAEGVADFADFLAGDDQDGIVRLCTLFGALLLSRATEGSPLSGEILAAAHAALTETGWSRARCGCTSTGLEAVWRLDCCPGASLRAVEIPPSCVCISCTDAIDDTPQADTSERWDVRNPTARRPDSG